MTNIKALPLDWMEKAKPCSWPWPDMEKENRSVLEDDDCQPTMRVIVVDERGDVFQIPI